MKCYEGHFSPRIHTGWLNPYKNFKKLKKLRAKSALMYPSFSHTLSAFNMNIARLSCLAFFSLALFVCDQTAKTPPTTAIKAREPVIGLALVAVVQKGFAHIGVIKVLESPGSRLKS